MRSTYSCSVFSSGSPRNAAGPVTDNTDPILMGPPGCADTARDMTIAAGSRHFDKIRFTIWVLRLIVHRMRWMTSAIPSSTRVDHVLMLWNALEKDEAAPRRQRQYWRP